jgi:hypothetical protein
MKGFVRHKGKGEVLLPNRAAVNQLARGEPWQKSINNYAKVAPTGEAAIDTPDITDMVQVKY